MRVRKWQKVPGFSLYHYATRRGNHLSEHVCARTVVHFCAKALTAPRGACLFGAGENGTRAVRRVERMCKLSLSRTVLAVKNTTVRLA